MYEMVVCRHTPNSMYAAITVPATVAKPLVRTACSSEKVRSFKNGFSTTLDSTCNTGIQYNEVQKCQIGIVHLMLPKIVSFRQRIASLSC